MRKVLAHLVIVLLAVPSNMETSLFAQSGSCAACQPQHANFGWDVAPGNLSVCFKSNEYHTWSTQEIGSFIDGMNYWTGFAGEQGRTIGLSGQAVTSANCPSEAIRVEYVKDTDMQEFGASAEAHGTPDGRGGAIQINFDYTESDFSQWAEMGAHEFGHFFGFLDFQSGCGTRTIMAWSWDGSHSLGEIDPCADRGAMTTLIRGGNSSQGDYSDPLGDDCYEWLYVTFWEEFDGYNWIYIGFTIDYDYGTYCGPPPY
jgi:hypothetical protein